MASNPAASQPIDTGPRLDGLKALMRAHDLSIYLVPTEDAHGSEYICPADARREYMTGFTGSAGTALVLLDEPRSLLFTDGRYFNQASKQLHPAHWQLMKQGLEGVPTWQEYLASAATAATPALRVGVDPTLVSAKDADALRTQLAVHSAQLVSIPENLVDQQWAAARPARPHQPIRQLDLQYAGQTTADKLAAVRARLTAASSSADAVVGMVVSALDEIAWFLNLRGSDIDYNPVFFAYLWISIDKEVVLFVSDQQLSPSVKAYLAMEGIEVRAYDAIWDFLHQLRSTRLQAAQGGPHPKVLISPTASLAIEAGLGGRPETVQQRSPLQDLKAVKNACEISGFRAAHVRDGAALVAFFAWLEQRLCGPDAAPIDEYAAACELERFRREMGGVFFQGLSFETISSSGKNAAIIHYSPEPQGSAVVERDEVYLCDSGAQYLDGTTDVTRTLHFGSPTAEQTRAFTRVLQGHISLATMVFPSKTTGFLLDAFARQFLWRDGLDYRHGTGHGVGHFLNVHEGPQGINQKIEYHDVPLKVGMTLSNEPGYYKDESFGIRIESVVVVCPKNTPNKFGDREYLGFENLTMCPIGRKLIEKEILSKEQVSWVDEYHQIVLETLSPLLKDDPRALDWLVKECQPL